MKSISCAAALALSILGTSSASAATLIATGTEGPQENFIVTFTDSNGNRLFDLDELVSFSGFLFYSDLLGVPDIPGISVVGVAPGAINVSAGFWNFGTGSTVEFASTPNFWTYELRGLAAIPLPASLPLLAAGLFGLALLRRRTRG